MKLQTEESVSTLRWETQNEVTSQETISSYVNFYHNWKSVKCKDPYKLIPYAKMKP